MNKITVLLGVFTLFGVFVGFSNSAFAVPENSMSATKPNFPESIRIGEKATFYLKMSNLEYDRVSDIESIITIMPKDASEFVHVEINSQISTLWYGYYQTTKGIIYVDKGIPVDRIFVSVSFMGNNQFGEQVSLTSDSTFNASIKIEKSQNEEILDDSMSDHEEKQDIDYVKYDFRKEARFDLPAFIKKNPLPLDIAQSMQDWCVDSPVSSKNDPQFWNAVPIRILSITPEFQSLQVKTGSFVINSHAAEELCPPNMWMVGTFASESGDKHRFSLFHDGDFFRYQIGEVQCKDGLVIATKSTDNSLVCVKPETRQKLIEHGWARDDALSTFDYIIEKDGVTYGSQYQISGGLIEEIVYNKHTNSLIVSLDKSENGFIQIVIQTGLLHLSDESPYTYIVLADGEEIAFEQLSPIVLKILFEAGTKKIEIVGTREI